MRRNNVKIIGGIALLFLVSVLFFTSTSGLGFQHLSGEIHFELEAGLEWRANPDLVGAAMFSSSVFSSGLNRTLGFWKSEKIQTVSLNSKWRILWLEIQTVTVDPIALRLSEKSICLTLDCRILLNPSELVQGQKLNFIPPLLGIGKSDFNYFWAPSGFCERILQMAHRGQDVMQYLPKTCYLTAAEGITARNSPNSMWMVSSSLGQSLEPLNSIDLKSAFSGRNAALFEIGESLLSVYGTHRFHLHMTAVVTSLDPLRLYVSSLSTGKLEQIDGGQSDPIPRQSSWCLEEFLAYLHRCGVDSLAVRKRIHVATVDAAMALVSSGDYRCSGGRNYKCGAAFQPLQVSMLFKHVKESVHPVVYHVSPGFRPHEELPRKNAARQMFSALLRLVGVHSDSIGLKRLPGPFLKEMKEEHPSKKKYFDQDSKALLEMVNENLNSGAIFTLAFPTAQWRYRYLNVYAGALGGRALAGVDTKRKISMGELRQSWLLDGLAAFQEKVKNQCIYQPSQIHKRQLESVCNAAQHLQRPPFAADFKMAPPLVVGMNKE